MKSVSFSTKRRFVMLPDKEFDAMHDVAFALALRRLKLAGVVVGLLVAATCWYFMAPAAEGDGSLDKFETGLAAAMFGAVGYAMFVLVLTRCVLRFACGGILRDFAKSEYVKRGAR